MIKTEYGRFDAPFYQQKLDDGLNVIFLPRNGKLNTAILYIPSGSYQHEEYINKVKTPYASAYVLQHLVLNEKRKSKFLDMKTLATSKLEYSYTLFKLETLNDIFKPTQELLNVFLKHEFDENDIDTLKKENKEVLLSYECDPLHQVEKGLLDNLYVSSLIKRGIQPTFNDVNLIHSSTIKNYIKKFASGNEMTLFISGNMSVEDVSKKIEELKVPQRIKLDVSKVKENEVYDRVNKPYSEKGIESDSNYLSFGIKFPKRQELYESYGQLLFEFYEILIPSLFSENLTFLEGLNNVQSRLIDAKLEQAGEDTCIILTFKTIGSSELIRFLTDYTSRLEKRLTANEFKAFIDNYYAKNLEKLSMSNTSLDEFARIYANNLAYTGLISSILKLSFNTYRNFLSKMNHFPKAAYYLFKKD